MSVRLAAALVCALGVAAAGCGGGEGSGKAESEAQRLMSGYATDGSVDCSNTDSSSGGSERYSCEVGVIANGVVQDVTIALRCEQEQDFCSRIGG